VDVLSTLFFRVCSVKITTAFVDVNLFENKYGYPDNYELQQHRRSSVVLDWYKKCITTASCTVLLGVARGPIHKNAHSRSLAPQTYVTYIAYSVTLIFLPIYVHSY